MSHVFSLSMSRAVFAKSDKFTSSASFIQKPREVIPTETMTNFFLKFQIVPMNLVTVAVAPALTLFAVRLYDAAALGLCLLIQAPEGQPR